MLLTRRCFVGHDSASNQHLPTSLASELPHIAAPLTPFLAACPPQNPSPSTDPPSPTQQARRDSQSPHHASSTVQEVQLDAESAAALALPPVLQPRHRMYQLSEKGILEMTGVSLLGMLTQLNLHGSALKRIEVASA